MNARLTIGGVNIGQTATFSVKDGTDLTVNGRLYVGDRNRGSLSSMIMSGGTIHMTSEVSGDSFYVANGQGTTNSAGVITLSGGRISFEAARAYTMYVGMNNNSATAYSRATFTQTGGTVEGNTTLQALTTNLVAANYTSSSYISLLGGTFSISGTAGFGNNAVAVVAGYVALTVSSNMDSAYFGGATNFAGLHTSLIFDVAQRDNWTGKTILTIGNSLTVNGAAGVVVDLSNFGLWDGANVGDTVTITLAQYTSLSKTSSTADTITGLDTDHFSASNITWGATAATIDVTYTNAIPEPAVAAGALGLLALAMAVRRRRI